jgi:hypothetical protein
MQHSIFAGLDLWVVLYAAGMASFISILTTWRARNSLRARGLPLDTSWLTAIPDTLAGALVGTFAGVLIPPHVPILDNLSGVTALCGGGGILGPKLWDLISSKGLNALLLTVSGPILGALAKNLAAQNKDGDSDGSKQAPPKPPV